MGTLIWTYVLFGLLFLILSIQEASSEYLSMNDDALDDQYEGCTEEMEREVMFSLLNKEKNADPEFEKIWEAAEEAWKEIKLRGINVPSGFQDGYGIALVAYTNSKPIFRLKFKEAMQKYDRKNFKYHSLHFLLTQALSSLRSSCGWSPWSLYKGVCGVLSSEYIGQKVRFGHFFSSFKNKKQPKISGNETFVTFTSCFGADIREFSYLPIGEEVLIPPDEVFKVKGVKDGDKITLVLETTRTRCHYYNCDYLCEVVGVVGDAGSMTKEQCLAYNGEDYKECVPSGGGRILPSMVPVTLLLCGLFFLYIEDAARC